MEMVERVACGGGETGGDKRGDVAVEFRVAGDEEGEEHDKIIL